jgi:fucose permease
LLYPALSTLISAILLFISLTLLKGTFQYVVLLFFGITILSFISGAAAVTQDVVHPGLRASSYAIAVVVQNLLGASTAPIIMGKIYDITNIQTALSLLPLVLLLGTVLFWLGSRHYVADLGKVMKIELEVA